MAKNKNKQGRKTKAKKGPPPKRQGGAAPKLSGFPVNKTVSRVAPKAQARRSAHVATCSMLDPFCIHARGAQRADGGPPTVPYQLRKLISITASGTTGTAKAYFLPNPAYGYNLCGVVGSDWTPVATSWAATADTFLTTYAKEFRIVSFGVVIRTVLSATSAKGMIIVSTQNAPLPTDAVPFGNMTAAETIVQPICPGQETSWISKPMGPSAHLFKPYSSYNTAGFTDFDWTSVTVEVVGSDTTTVIPLLSVEFVMNVEITLGSGTSSANLAQLQRPAPPAMTHALAAASHAQASVPSIIQGGIATVGKKLESAAATALDDILSSGMALLFG